MLTVIELHSQVFYFDIIKYLQKNCWSLERVQRLGTDITKRSHGLLYWWDNISWQNKTKK